MQQVERYGQGTSRSSRMLLMRSPVQLRAAPLHHKSGLIRYRFTAPAPARVMPRPSAGICCDFSNIIYCIIFGAPSNERAHEGGGTGEEGRQPAAAPLVAFGIVGRLGQAIDNDTLSWSSE